MVILLADHAVGRDRLNLFLKGGRGDRLCEVVVDLLAGELT